MASPERHKGLPRVAVLAEALGAEVVFPEDVDPQALAREVLIAAASEAGVAIDERVQRCIDEALESYRAGAGGSMRVPIATAEHPVSGEDGRIEWCVDEPGSPTEESSGEPSDTENGGAVDFYSQSAFVFVKEGDRLGRLFPAPAGEDGRDVRGNAIAARHGREASLSIDDSITRQPDGSLFANRDGVLCRQRDKAFVKDQLVVEGFVDFSSGNVDFDGSVMIHRGVRDKFEVRATGAVEIGGLVEAAHVQAGSDVHLQGGMAGRDQGTISCQGSLTAKYLDSIKADVAGDLVINKECISSHISVVGNVDSPAASVIGGELVAGGRVEIAALGSERGTETRIELGAIPGLAEKLADLDALLEEVGTQHEHDQRELERLTQPGRKLAPNEIERQTELSFSVHAAQQKLDRARQLQKEIDEKLHKHRVVELVVNRVLHNGVVICLNDREYVLQSDHRGPLTVAEDARHSPVIRQGDGYGVSLAAVSELRAAA
ncbi:MAG: FapA family protein [Planctomycetota bacterium]